MDLRGTEGLKRISLFEGVPEADLAALASACAWAEFVGDEEIIDQHGDTKDVFLVVDGAVRIMAYDPATGRDVALANVEAGDYFGELAAIDGLERSARVQATESALIAAMDRETFLGALRRHPDVALRVLERFSRIIRSLDSRVTELSTKSIDQRICSELLRLAEIDTSTSYRSGGGEVWYVPSMPGHKELASWVGTSREDVAKVIGQLARDKLIERRNMSLYLRDVGRLRLIAGEGPGEPVHSRSR